MGVQALGVALITAVSAVPFYTAWRILGSNFDQALVSQAIVSMLQSIGTVVVVLSIMS